MNQNNPSIRDAKPPSDGTAGKIELRLFVAGLSARSQTAIRTIYRYCEEELHGAYLLEVVDIYQQPEMARREQIVATPALIRVLPTPRRMMIGDLSRLNNLFSGSRRPVMDAA